MEYIVKRIKMKKLTINQLKKKKKENYEQKEVKLKIILDG